MQWRVAIAFRACYRLCGNAKNDRFCARVMIMLQMAAAVPKDLSCGISGLALGTYFFRCHKYDYVWVQENLEML